MMHEKTTPGWLSDIKLRNLVQGVIGSGIVAFGLYNIHDAAVITEGGGFGLNLLLEYWFGISPAFTNAVLTLVCYIIGWKALGKSFIVYSFIFSGAFSLFYRILECFTPRLFPEIAGHPLLAALSGGVFVGLGAGLSVRAGGAQSGDDALAMALRQFSGVKLSTVYLVSDLIVLLLSLTYIPLNKILCSLVTVILSGQIIELATRIGKGKEKTQSIYR